MNSADLQIQEVRLTSETQALVNYFVLLLTRKLAELWVRNWDMKVLRKVSQSKRVKPIAILSQRRFVCHLQVRSQNEEANDFIVAGISLKSIPFHEL